MLSSSRAFLLLTSLILNASCIMPENQCSSLWTDKPLGSATDPALEQDFCQIDSHVLALSEQADGVVWAEGLEGLLQTYDFLDLAMVERRLRRLDTEAHLLAVPSSLIPDGFTLRSFKGEPMRDGYFLMVVFGDSPTQDRKRSAWKAGTRDENLDHLKVTGQLVPVLGPGELSSNPLVQP